MKIVFSKVGFYENLKSRFVSISFSRNDLKKVV